MDWRECDGEKLGKWKKEFVGEKRGGHSENMREIQRREEVNVGVR